MITVLKKKFPKWQLIEAERLETKDGHAYEFGMRKDGRGMEVIADLDGKVLKKEIEDDKEGEDGPN